MGVEFIQKVSDYNKILDKTFYLKNIRNSKAQKEASKITKIAYRKLMWYNIYSNNSFMGKERIQIAAGVAGILVGLGTMLEPLAEIYSKTEQETSTIIAENQTRYSYQVIIGAILAILSSEVASRGPNVIIKPNPQSSL